MPTVEVDDFVYGYLHGVAAATQQTLGAVLRALVERENRSGGWKTPPEASGHHELAGFLGSSKAAGATVKARLLSLLSWLHGADPEGFEKVLELSGHKRRYFARTAAELRASGNSVNPKRIPGADFWVVTNNDTASKKRLIAQVLAVMGYGAQATAFAQRYLDHGREI